MAREQRWRGEDAVRLGVRAGRERVDGQGWGRLEPSTRTTAVRSALTMAEFDEVASAFEVSAYSEATTSAVDASDARDGWSEVFRVLDSSAPPYDRDETA